MNLVKLFETQKALDARILEQHPELKGQNNLVWKILALQVELGECANEWRGFKKWSNDQEPRRWKHDDICLTCDGKGVLLDWGAMNFWECEECRGTGEVEDKGDPLIEEYVDCLHFILSVGLECDCRNYEFTNVNTLPSATLAFSYLIREAFNLNGAKKESAIFYSYLNFFISFGLKHLGFTWEQIEDAYYAKNKINHERQNTGY